MSFMVNSDINFGLRIKVDLSRNKVMEGLSTKEYYNKGDIVSSYLAIKNS